MKKLVIIPAYNEAGNLPQVVSDLNAAAPECDFVVVDDGSKDRTAQLCHEYGWRYLKLPLNLGIGGAVQAGYLYAAENAYDIAIQFDGDGQHDASYIHRITDPIERGEADCVIGSRFLTGEGFQSSLARRMGIGFFSHLIKLCSGHRVTDATSGFRAVSSPLIHIFADDYAQDYPEPEAVMSILAGGYRLIEVPVVMRERQGGQSSIRHLKTFYYMAKVSLAIMLRAAIAASSRKEAHR